MASGTPRQRRYRVAITAQLHDLGFNRQAVLDSPPEAPPPNALLVDMERLRARRDARRIVARLGSFSSSPPPFLFTFVQSSAGPTLAFVTNPAWETPAGLAGGLRVLSWKMARYTNSVGTWEAELPVDDQLVAGAPLHTQIKRGWHLSLVQENNHPLGDPEKDYLLYEGVVQTREYKAGAASATLVLRGMLRTAHLVDRQTWAGFPVTNYGQGFEDLVQADDIIGPDGGVTYPAAYSGMATASTYHGISRFAALERLAAKGRLLLRESWGRDRPDLVRVDAPPYSGAVFTNVESFDPGQADAGLYAHIEQQGYGFITGTPTVRYEGIGVVNRIEPIGSDTHLDPDDDTPLTLAHATATSPYTVQVAINPDGTARYYLEDTDSQARYGIVEMRLQRTDVKNPSDDPGTRQAAANVLHAVASGELLKRKSEVMEVKLDIANGLDIWALPGDSVVLQYSGYVTTEDGDQVDWLDINRLFLITGRNDASDESGVRQVSFRVAAPEVQIEVPGLPAAIPALPGQTTQPSFPVPDSPLPPGAPELPGSSPEIPDCCDDPTADEEGGAGVPLAEPPRGTPVAVAEEAAAEGLAHVFSDTFFLINSASEDSDPITVVEDALVLILIQTTGGSYSTGQISSAALKTVSLEASETGGSGTKVFLFSAQGTGVNDAITFDRPPEGGLNRFSLISVWRAPAADITEVLEVVDDFAVLSHDEPPLATGQATASIDAASFVDVWTCAAVKSGESVEQEVGEAFSVDGNPVLLAFFALGDPQETFRIYIGKRNDPDVGPANVRWRATYDPETHPSDGRLTIFTVRHNRL